MRHQFENFIALGSRRFCFEIVDVHSIYLYIYIYICQIASSDIVVSIGYSSANQELINSDTTMHASRRISYKVVCSIITYV